MELSNPIKLMHGLEIIDISVDHIANVEEETVHYVDSEYNPLYEDTEFCAVCRDTVSMIIKDDSFDDMVFKCECDRIDPIELYEYLLADWSDIGVIDFCLDFARKFGNPFDTSREDSLICNSIHSGWSYYTLEESIRSAVISSIRCHLVDGWIDTIEIAFSDKDAIKIYLNLDKQKKIRESPVNSFTIIERILCMLEPRCSTGKEELLKKITSYLGFLVNTINTDEICIVESYLFRYVEKITVFYTKSADDLHAKFMPVYMDRNCTGVKDIKIFQDADMIFDL